MLLKTFLFVFCIINVVRGVPLTEFFPFGSTAGDQFLPVNDDGSTSALPLPRNFPYFDNNHRQIYLANNGLFSFLGPVSEFVATPFPLGNGWRVIAGFWSDIDTRGNISSGNQVSYHIYNSGDNSTAFEKARLYVQQYFPGERAFTPSMVITGTWYRVGAYFSQTDRTNTFQIVLTTDEIRSFAFILYHDLQWATPSSSNAAAGIYGQAGFNAGDGIVFQMLPYSRTSDVVRLTEISNVNVPGLFVFRTDSDTIALGGCGENATLQFRPRRASQLGSTAITVKGPCFTNTTEGQVKCRFGESLVVDAIVINEFQAICLAPAVPLPTFTYIYLSVDEGLTYELISNIFTYTRAEYGIASTDNSEVRLVDQADTVINVGSAIQLEWFFSEATMNTWPNGNMPLEVQMWTVMLNETNEGIQQTGSTVLQTNLVSTGGVQSTTVTIPSTGGASLQTIFFRIVARHANTNRVYAGLSSALYSVHDSTTSTTRYCEAWAANQPEATTWNEQLLLCPMTLAQARVARCCYEPDPLCTEYNHNSSMNCRLHRGRAEHDESSAVACYLSLSETAAGAECCYDAQGQIITRGTGAGTDDRYRPTSLPVLHYFSDTLPYLACCLLTSSYESCETYFRLRPTRRGSNTRNAGGGTWGDPHFITLDGTPYTFNGHGEYTYLAVTASATSLNTAFDPSTQTVMFNSQIRTAPLDATSNAATVIRGLAAKSNHPQAERMSITISRRNMIIVRRGNETLDLDATNDNTVASDRPLTLFFPEMTLEKNRTNGALTLSWFVSVSIQITPVTLTNGLVLNLGISVADAHQQRTFGLLGLYDNNAANDLRTQNGTIVGEASTLTLQQIHYQFGQTWAINPIRSLFHYESDESAIYYANQNLQYVPSFVLPNMAASRVSSALAACGIAASAEQSTWTVSQQTCYYDIAVTNDVALGQSSRTAAETIARIEEEQRFPPEFNAALPLILTVQESTPTAINFTAVSPYTSSIIYTLNQGPASASFNTETAIFSWPSPSGKGTTIVRVSAQDTLYNLRSTHELAIRVTRPLPASAGNLVSVSSMLIVMSIVAAFI